MIASLQHLYFLKVRVSTSFWQKNALQMDLLLEVEGLSVQLKSSISCHLM